MVGALSCQASRAFMTYVIPALRLLATVLAMQSPGVRLAPPLPCWPDAPHFSAG